MTTRWIWLPLLTALTALAACGGSSGPTNAEDIPREYWRAMADEDWSKVWGLFSADVKELCTFDYFLQSREWFKEQSGDSYDFWLNRYVEFSEDDWEVDTSSDAATLRLPGYDSRIEAVLEDGNWRVASSGEYITCLPFRP